MKGSGADGLELRGEGILKAEFAWRHLAYTDLVEKLRAIGVAETEANLRNKISRDGYSAAFFLQCLYAIGVHTLHLASPPS